MAALFDMSSNIKITGVSIYQTSQGITKPIVVKLDTDAGVSGFGEVGLAYGAGQKAGLGILKDLASFVIGSDPRNIEALWEKLYRNTFWGGGGGPVVYGGISAIDTACWDIMGKLLNVPVYMLLGGKCREDLRTYASQIQFGWGNELKRLADPAEYAEAALIAVEDGYDCVKVDPVAFDQNGVLTGFRSGILQNADIRLGAERVKAIRDAVGPDVDIILELHSNFNVEAAIQFGRAVEDYNCMCYEEPINPMNVDSFAKVAQNVKIPLAGGERIYTRWGYRPFFEKQAISLIQPDLGLVGGITEGKKVCDLANIYDVTVQCHVAGGPIATAVALHMETAIPNFAIHEYHVACMYENISDTCAYDYKPEGGRFKVPELPGIGQELSQHTMASCEQEHFT